MFTIYYFISIAIVHYLLLYLVLFTLVGNMLHVIWCIQ